MDYAIVAVPAAPVRRKPSHRKEMVNQLLFGEAVRLLKREGDLWVKVRSLHDGYEGWMTRTLLQPVTVEQLEAKPVFVTAGMLNSINRTGETMWVPPGSSLPFFDAGKGMLGPVEYQYSGPYIKKGERPASADWVPELAMAWLNAPYCWGGRTPLGVDCSGFTQVVFKQMGIDLPRDAWQQAQDGRAVKKFSDHLPGDLAFFDNKEDIVHVGILLGEGQLIHASGRVRIDTVDKKGITGKDAGTPHTRLRAIRRYW